MSSDRRASQRYDRDYFDHWYRDEGFDDPDRLERKVSYAIGAAEYLLERPITSVLDVGCGEGVWQPAVAKRRPGTRYVGVDLSEYAVERYGSTRGLRQLGIGELDGADLDVDGRFDLVVCVDVIAYVGHDELRRGLRSMARMLAGVAFIEVFTDADEFVGDRDHYHARPPATYDRWFAAAGLRRIGPHLYAGEGLLGSLATFEQR
jgi:cyclopropane fatty-acyl-phospholipid synthase-like methyltransferase